MIRTHCGSARCMCASMWQASARHASALQGLFFSERSTLDLITIERDCTTEGQLPVGCARYLQMVKVLTARFQWGTPSGSPNPGSIFWENRLCRRESPRVAEQCITHFDLGRHVLLMLCNECPQQCNVCHASGCGMMDWQNSQSDLPT